MQQAICKNALQYQPLLKGNLPIPLFNVSCSYGMLLDTKIDPNILMMVLFKDGMAALTVTLIVTVITASVTVATVS